MDDGPQLVGYVEWTIRGQFEVYDDEPELIEQISRANHEGTLTEFIDMADSEHAEAYWVPRRTT